MEWQQQLDGLIQRLQAQGSEAPREKSNALALFSLPHREEDLDTISLGTKQERSSSTKQGGDWAGLSLTPSRASASTSARKDPCEEDLAEWEASLEQRARLLDEMEALLAGLPATWAGEPSCIEPQAADVQRASCMPR
ncbi:unnamed protein product [Effrenium voratum]|uniref:Uncharacterized protein n=1 Tax=Effrenium voratum TaxID=2562239 RepID=A0AA36J4B7_9DINO|nr:unnamed protein product [Effrenium voratum]CAJ1445724.1 unnamed protein product [Effrenium voratum]